ncbi:acyl-CoA desaturase [Ahniella affigens]|uniref:Acyl-CoA desaturase n=1 Tax=Ahniella affigens TaxID=2021234 RepID=A0A2P1PP26_9GAMM|nr:fatty acid desaturase [Ahniella affigens]AVP96586.1 acyl-CoA desaturase [Ahniella affigens]
MSILDFLAHGLTGSPTWLVIAYFFAVTQLTIFGTTLFLHRSAAHRSVEFHPLIAHVFRFWTWLTTAMVTRDWVAIHRKHHARVETEEDPHSPVAHGIWKVVFHGVTLYQEAKKDREMIMQFSQGLEDDFIERKLYAAHPNWGPSLMFFINLALFGFIGVAIWAFQMLWIPVMAAGVVNGLGHWWGYRNFETDDRSTNLTPWAFFIGGEELHNNHHAYPSSAKFQLRRYEWDIGWSVISLLRRLGLAKVLRIAPTLHVRPNIQLPDAETLKAAMTVRFELSKRYFREVIRPTLHDELAAAKRAGIRLSGRLRRGIASDGRWLSNEQREAMETWLATRPSLATLVEHRRRLNEILARTSKNAEERLEALRAWCSEAEASGSRALAQFAADLRGWSLAPQAV